MKCWIVEVRGVGGWTRHSAWISRADAREQADIVGGRAVRGDDESPYTREEGRAMRIGH